MSADIAEHEAISTEQLAVLCFDRPDRPADALPRLNYLATRALLVRFEHPGTHPAEFPGDDLKTTTPAGLPTPQPAAWPDGKRWAWSLGQGGAYWAGGRTRPGPARLDRGVVPIVLP